MFQSHRPSRPFRPDDGIPRLERAISGSKTRASSSTSSNVLFSDLQHTVARLKGLPEAAIIAAQSAGGSIGNGIAPANVVLGASTAGISGQEGAILRKTIPWTLMAVVVTGAVTVLLVMLTGGGTGGPQR